jgi:SAM-dependent methyltransferase
MAGAEFVAGEAGRLPFDEGAFTALLCTSAFHHVPDAERALAEMRRVLAPGGRLALGDACADRRAVRIADRVLRAFQPGHIRFYRSAELRDMLRAAGLEPLESRALWEGAYLIVLAGKPS